MTYQTGTFDSISTALKRVQPLLKEITQAATLRELAESIYQVLETNFAFTSTGFYFINPESKNLELVFGKGLSEKDHQEAESSAMERHPGWVFRNKKTYLSDHEEPEILEFQKRLGLVSRIYAPVLFKDECVGTIGVASNTLNAFSENHVAFLEFICQIAAVAYENITHMLEVEKSKERLDIAVKAVKFGVWDWDIRNNTLIWDDYMYELYEQNKSDFSHAYDAFEKTLHPDDVARVNQEIADCFARQEDFRAEFRVLTKDGRTKRIAANGKSFYSPEGKILRAVGANWDVTETREHEARLIQASKMSSLGEMSSGIAHEINNPLAIIHGKSQMIRKALTHSLTDPAQIRKLTEDIDNTVGRISKIIKGLQIFSRDGENDPFEKRTVKAIVDDTLAFCFNRFKHHEVEIRCNSIDEALSLECRPPQISQVLLNLLNNAFDAIHALPEKWVSIDVTDEKDSILIIVTDSGNGIPKSIQTKIMEPFFTTKEVGKGTGLGLSISLGILKSHEGSLRIDPKHQNTRFVITLPKNQNRKP